jgi:GTP-binding protein EngB required for normal cell division
VIRPLADAERRALVDDTRQALARLAGLARDAGRDDELTRVLAEARSQLDQGFLLVVVGEFNSGKSAFINGLLGLALLEEGVTPTTSRIGQLVHGDERARRLEPDGVETIAAPVEILRTVTIVDTPGTNAVLREHEALTRRFVPRAELVIFLTSADRPFSESERAFLEALREWGKKVVVVVNKADLLESEADRERVIAFVREQAAATIGTRPEVFALSARLARQGRLAGDAGLLESSGLPAFEARVTARLDEAERFRLKLFNPLGVARSVCGRLDRLAAQRLELLAEDVETLTAVAGLLGTHGERLDRDFQLRVADVEKVLLEFERRGNAFFEERLRLGRFRALLDRERLRRDFEQDVVSDLPRQVERRVEALVDWLVAEDLGLWQETMRLLRGRLAAHAERLEGLLDDRFAYDRQERLLAVGEQAQRAVEGYDAAGEGRRLAERVREAVAGAALLQVSALGLGAVVAALASTTAADVSGFVAAGTLAVLGLLVLPARRRQARRELAAKVASLRETLIAALTQSVARERDRSAARVRAAVAPYESFVGSERRRLEQARSALSELARALDSIEGRVDGLSRRPAPVRPGD